MVTLGAVPARFVSREASHEMTAEEALTNAGFTGPIRIAQQSSHCPVSVQQLRQFIAPTNLWQAQATPADPESLKQVKGSLQAVAMGTPVPALTGLSSDYDCSAFGQSPGFIRNFHAARLEQIANTPTGLPQFTANVVCSPNTYGAWFGASQQAFNDACVPSSIQEEGSRIHADDENSGMI